MDKCDVFISYRRRDGIYAARLLYKYIEQMGYDNIFLDLEKIKGGKFPKILEDKLKECKDFLFLVTPETFEFGSEDKDYVYHELRLALERFERGDKINIIPVFTIEQSDFKGCVFPENITKLKEFDGFIFNINYSETVIRMIISSELKNRMSSETQQSECIPHANYVAVKDVDRLSIQSKNIEECDKVIILNIRDKLGKTENLTVLDVGCAHGVVGRTRFCDNAFSLVLGIDRDSDCIKRAKAATTRDMMGKFFYEYVDIEANLEGSIEDMLSFYNIPCFDIVFVSLVLHFVKNPTRILKTFRKYLSPGGFIILRGSDDGSKLANDDGTLDGIINLTINAPGVADRKHGRKIYKWLTDASYKNIEIISKMRDTSQLDADGIESLYEESFEYRKTLYPDGSLKYCEMSNLLEKMSSNLHNNMWYCEYDYYGIAQAGKKLL